MIRARAILIAGVLVLGFANDLPRAQTSVPLPARHTSCNGEVDCLQKFPSVATRAGDVLTLKLANGKTKTFTSNTTTDNVDEYVRYVLIGHYPARHSFVISARFDEGSSTILVSSRTGHETELIDEPRYSPSGKRMAAVIGCDAICENGIDIWSATDPPTLEWRYRPAQYELYEFVRWNGDDRLQMHVTMRVGTELRESLPVEAVRTRDGWKLLSPVLPQ